MKNLIIYDFVNKKPVAQPHELLKVDAWGEFAEEHLGPESCCIFSDMFTSQLSFITCDQNTMVGLIVQAYQLFIDRGIITVTSNHEERLKELEEKITLLQGNFQGLIDRFKDHESLQGQKETAIFNHVEDVKQNYCMSERAAKNLLDSIAKGNDQTSIS